MKKLLWFALLLGVVNGVLRGVITTDTNPGPDGNMYLSVARQFLAEPFPWTSTLSQTSWAPGWPAVLAVLFRVFGDSAAVYRWANVVCWLATLLIAYWLVGRLFDKDLALLAVALASWHNMATFIKYANYEPFLTLLTTAVLYLLVTWVERPGTWRMAAAGTLAGYAALVQGKMVAPLGVCAAAALAHVLLRGPARRAEAALQTSTFALAFFLVTLPYSLNNLYQQGRFSFVADVGPMNLVIGNGPYANGAWVWTPMEKVPTFLDVPASDRSRAALKWVAHQIQADPARFLLCVIPLKFWNFWGLEKVRQNILLILFVLGLLVWSRMESRRPGFLLWLPVACMLSIHLVYYGFERYQYPVAIPIVTFAALAFRLEWRVRPLETAAVLAATALCLGWAHSATATPVLRTEIARCDDQWILGIWLSRDAKVTASLTGSDGRERACGNPAPKGAACYACALPAGLSAGPVRVRIRGQRRELLYEDSQIVPAQ